MTFYCFLIDFGKILGSKIDQQSINIDPNSNQKSDAIWDGFWMALGAILGRFWGQVGGQFGAQIDPKSIKKSTDVSCDRFFNRFSLQFALQFGQKIDPKSKKVRLKSTFGKTSEKYTFSGRKSTLPKCKNIAKTIEGCLKSCFSHIRNKVKKVTLKSLILERFLEQKATQDREKVVSKLF